MIEMFTDGAGGPKKIGPDRPPRSGWAFVVMTRGASTFEACGVIEPQVTTQAAELEAMIRALNFIHETPPRIRPVTIWTDSRYVADTVARVTGYADDGFTLPNGKPLANSDRIRMIYDYLFPLGECRNVNIRWTEGHSGVPGNERADKLCTLAAYKNEERFGQPLPL